MAQKAHAQQGWELLDCPIPGARRSPRGPLRAPGPVPGTPSGTADGIPQPVCAAARLVLGAVAKMSVPVSTDRRPGPRVGRPAGPATSPPAAGLMSRGLWS